MNLIVWIMVFTSHGSHLTTGSEFPTKKKCEDAAELIVTAVKQEYLAFARIDKPLCIRIEK